MTATSPKAPKRRKQDLVSFQIREFPLALKRTLIRTAAERNVSMNDLAVSALAERFKVSYHPSTRKPGVIASNETDLVVFIMPRTLRRAIKLAATRQDMFQREVVLAALSAAFAGGKK